MSASKSVRDDRRLLDKELMTDFLARLLAIFDAFVLERMSNIPRPCAIPARDGV